MSQDLYVHNIGELVTCRSDKGKAGKAEMNDLGIIPGPAAVLIRGGIIQFAGSEKEIDPSLLGNIPHLNAHGCTVLPGFVDSHTHLVFGGYREEEFQWRLAGESYMSIMERGGGIASTTKATRAASHETLLRDGHSRLFSLLAQGVTTCEIKSGYGMDRETELKQLAVIQALKAESPLTIFSTYMGAHDVPPEYKEDPDGYLRFMITEMLPLVAREKLADCCDIFTEKGVFNHEQTRQLLTAATAEGLAVKMHADEIVPFGGAELAAELGCLSADHLLKISEAGIRALSQSETVATCLPLTAFSLREPYAPAREMIDAGCRVALASDLNPGSCFSASIPLMIALATLYMSMTLEETISALTANAAYALRLHDRVGSIQEGKQGDLVLLRYPSYRFLSYHFGMNIVRSVVARGVAYENRLTPIH